MSKTVAEAKSAEVSTNTILELDPDIVAMPIFQGRYDTVSDERIESLAKSIFAEGQINPITVVKLEKEIDGYKYRVTTGATRLEAVSRLKAGTVKGLKAKEKITVKCQVVEKESPEQTIAENVQRKNLSPMDVAFGMNYLKTEFSYTTDKIAKMYGVSKGEVSKALCLLTLPKEFQVSIHSGLDTDLSASAGYTIYSTTRKQTDKKNEAVEHELYGKLIEDIKAFVMENKNKWPTSKIVKTLWQDILNAAKPEEKADAKAGKGKEDSETGSGGDAGKATFKSKIEAIAVRLDEKSESTGEPVYSAWASALLEGGETLERYILESCEMEIAADSE